MQHYILKTNELFNFTQQINAGSKVKLSAWFATEEHPNIFSIDINILNTVKIVNIEKKNNLYWTLLDETFLTIPENLSNITLKSTISTFVVLTVANNKTLDNESVILDFTRPEYININKNFCNEKNYKGCPSSKTQCYNHETIQNSKFCENYKDTNKTSPINNDFVNEVDFDKFKETNEPKSPKLINTLPILPNETKQGEVIKVRPKELKVVEEPLMVYNPQENTFSEPRKIILLACLLLLLFTML